MAYPKIGLIMTEAGITSIVLLGDTEDSLKLYGTIREAVEAFAKAMKKNLQEEIDADMDRRTREDADLQDWVVAMMDSLDMDRHNWC